MSRCMLAPPALPAPGQAGRGYAWAVRLVYSRRGGRSRKPPIGPSRRLDSKQMYGIIGVWPTPRPSCPCGARATSPSSRGRATPRSWSARARSWACPALALTDRDGVYGAVRAHVAARESGRAPHHRLAGHDRRRLPVVLLAPGPAGYANLCRLITSGRLRSPQGRVLRRLARGGRARPRADRAVVAAGSAAGRRPRPLAGAAARGVRRPALRAGRAPPAPQEREAEARLRGRGRAPRAARSWPRRGALPRPRAPARCRTCSPHPPRREPRGTAGTLPAAQRPARAASARRARPRLFATTPTPVERTPRSPRAAPSPSPSSLPLPRRAPARRHDAPREWLRAAHASRAPRERYGGAIPADVAAQLEQRARADRRARLRRLLPDDVGDRRVLPRARHPLPGPRLGGQLGGLLLPRHHRGRSGAHGPAVRALPLARARRAARHRPRHRARAPRGGDPARLREVRPRPRRDGGERHPLPRRARRCATWARRSASPRPRSTALAKLLSRRTATSTPRRSADAGLDPARRAHAHLLAPGRARSCDFPRHLSIHPGGFLLGARAGRTTSSRSRTRRCPTAP